MNPAANKSPLTPKLRFPEFRDGPSWETQTLGSLAALSTEKVGDIRKHTDRHNAFLQELGLPPLPYGASKQK